MKFELTMKGVMHAKPIKSSYVSPPVVTPLQKPKVLLTNTPAPSPAPSPVPSIPTVVPATKVTPGVFQNTRIASMSTIHQNFS